MTLQLHVPSLNPKKATMQYFASSTCKHCRDFDETFAGLATGSLPSQGVEFMCIDVTPSKDGGAAAKKNGVSTFPTIRLVGGGKTMHYPSNMPRTHDKMSLWLLKALKDLQNAGAHPVTARAGDPHMDQQASLRGDDRASTYVPGQFVYGRNNTNIKYRQEPNTAFQNHRDRMRHNASQYHLSFQANKLDSDVRIRDSYASQYETGQDVPLSMDQANYAVLDLGTEGDIGY